MSTLKSDLLKAIEMAVELCGSMDLEEGDATRAWLDSVRKKVEGGSEYDVLRRKLSAARIALEAVDDLVGKALEESEHP